MAVVAICGGAGDVRRQQVNVGISFHNVCLIKIRSKHSSNTIFFMRQTLNEEWKSLKSHVISEIQVKQIWINQSVGLFVYSSYNTDCTLMKGRLLS